MSPICCLSVTGRRSAPGCERPGLTDPELARQRLELPASELDSTWPDAAGSLREGMHDTLTLMRFATTGQLAKALCSTNQRESMIEIVRYTQHNVKRWQDGDMRKRWTAAGLPVAEQQFRRIIGYRDLDKLVTAIERHAILAAPTNPAHMKVAEPVLRAASPNCARKRVVRLPAAGSGATRTWSSAGFLAVVRRSGGCEAAKRREIPASAEALDVLLPREAKRRPPPRFRADLDVLLPPPGVTTDTPTRTPLPARFGRRRANDKSRH
jgi:hypothetical protein